MFDTRGRVAALLVVGAVTACGAPPADTAATAHDAPADAAASATPAPAGGQPLEVPSDAGARYYVLARGGTAARPTILTQRDGPSGTSYSLREYDCAARRVRYLGSGDTREAAEHGHADPELSPIVDGAIADYVGRAACQR